MKALSISLALAASLSMRVCGSDDTPPPPPATPEQPTLAGKADPPPAPPPVETPPREAQHGGTVVVVGEHAVEVVSHASGEVEAYVLGAAPPVQAELRVEVPVARGPAQSVTLQWDDQRGHFHGRVRDVVIVPGPLVVHLVVGASVWVGRVTTFVIAPAVVVEVHHHRKHRKHKKHKKHRKHH